MTVSPQIAAAAASNRTPADVIRVRELALEYVKAQDAYRVLIRAEMNSDLTLEQRADLVLEMDAASAVMFKAREALNAAQRAQQVAA